MSTLQKSVFPWPAYRSIAVLGRQFDLPKPLSKDLFYQVIGTWPRLCSDVIFVDYQRKIFYLADRRVDPSGPWMIGGTILAKEEELSAAIRRLKIETGLTISPKRLRFVWFKRYIFESWDSACYLFSLELTPKEQKAVKLDNSEYESDRGLKPFSRQDLAEGVKKDKGRESPFPILLMAYDAIFSG